MSSSLLDGECFYTLNPSRSNKNQFPNNRGYFADLLLYCGFSFIRNKSINGLTSTDNGILDWSMYIRHLDKSNIRGAKTLREKQLTVVGYFFEMCYDQGSRITKIINNYLYNHCKKSIIFCKVITEIEVTK